MTDDDELFLSYQGGVQQNSLQHVLQTQYDIQNPLQILQGSSYYYTDSFKTLVGNKGNNFIQSINATFNELEAYVLELEQMQFNYSVLCLQECWLHNNDDISQIQTVKQLYINCAKGTQQHKRRSAYLHTRDTHL